MYSLLIVDDEKLIREGLIAYIDWRSLGVEIAGVFGSAKEALAAAGRRTPDIVISDIKMPGMSGVEFLKELRAAGCRSEVVFISAYRNFDYAKEAVRYGAFDYLLKPIREDMLYATVRRCVDKLRAAAADGAAAGGPGAAADPEAELRRYAAAAAPDAASMPDVAEWARIAAAYGVDPAAEAVVVAAPGPAPAVPRFPAAAVPEGGRVVVVAGGGGGGACLVAALGVPAGAAKATAAALAAGLVPAGAAYGWSGAAGAELPRLRTEALWGLIGAEAKPLRCPGSFAAAERYARSKPAAPFEPAAFVEALGRDDPALADATAEAALAGLFLGWLAEGSAYNFELAKARAFKALDSVLAELAAFPHFGAGLDDFKRRVDALSAAPDVYALFRAAQGLAGDLGAFVREKYAGNVSRLLSLVAAYLKDNLAADLSLESVAERFKASPTYLSRIFAREMGESFSRYRARARVERAKLLLKDPRYRVAEVAALVGLDNVTHFTKLFGALVGATPTEYRKKLQ
jgi:two-component system response regulator YesN